MNNPHRDPAWSRLKWDLFDETMPKTGVGGARTKPAGRKIIEMDQLEIASADSGQEQEPANPAQMELEIATSRADECGLHP